MSREIPHSPQPEAPNTEIITNPLPDQTKVGDVINFTDTIISNTEEFDSVLWLEIARKFDLNPSNDQDYQKIQELAKDDQITQSIKEKLTQQAERSYQVVDIVCPESDIQAEPNLDYDQGFFSQFNHLPNNGIKKIDPQELRQVKVGYIGGGINTEAYKIMSESQIYGGQGNQPTYFSTDYEMAMTHIADENDQPILIEVSLTELTKRRQALQDPESTYIEDEKGKSFIVFNGIPSQAITRILVLKKE